MDQERAAVAEDIRLSDAEADAKTVSEPKTEPKSGLAEVEVGVGAKEGGAEEGQAPADAAKPKKSSPALEELLGAGAEKHTAGPLSSRSTTTAEAAGAGAGAGASRCGRVLVARV